MSYFLAKWVINILSLFVVAHVVAGISTDGWQATIVAALVLGALNAFLRPILIGLTLPINILSLGSFTLIINGFLFYLTSRFVPGFAVASFGHAFLAAILFSIISFILNIALGPAFTVRMSYPGRRSGPREREGGDDGVIDVEAKVEEEGPDK
ncbi:MAG: phage holin family protein [Candidatus Omnitrophota bacterium]